MSVKLPRVLFSDSTANVVPEPVTPRLLGPLVKVTVPLGLTLKLMVPPLCFENVSGLGLVVTETTQGVGVGVGVTPGDAPGDADGVAEGVGVGVAVAVGVAVGVGVGSGPTSGVGVGVASSPGPTGVGVGVAVLLPLLVEPPSIPVKALTLIFTLGTSSR